MHVVDLAQKIEFGIEALVLIPEPVDRAPAAAHARAEVIGIESEQAVGLLDELAGFLGERQHCLERIEQHIGRDGFAQVNVPDVLSLDRLISELVEFQLFPRRFVLAAAARRCSGHVLRFDGDTRLPNVHEEKATRHDRRALTGAVAVGRGEFAGGIGEWDNFAGERATLLAAPAVRCGGQWLRVAVDAAEKGDARRDREERIRLDPLKIPRAVDGEIDVERTPTAIAPFAVLPGLQRAMGEHHRGDAARLEVQIDAAREEQSRHILVGGVTPAGPDFVDGFALAFEFGADYGFGAVVGEPGRVADDYVYGVGAEGDGADQIAGVVGPDVVAPVGVEAGEGVGGAFEHRAVGVVGDADVVERLARVAALLEFFGETGHEAIEPVALLDKGAGEFEQEVAFEIAVVVFDFDRYGAAGEEAGGFGAQLE